MLKTMKKFRKERPKISDQFADLKRNLSTVSQEEWDAIPEVGDYASLRLRQKRQQLEKFSPMPDNIINSAAQQNAARSALDSRQQRYGGMETPIGGMTSVVGGLQSVLSGMRSVGGTTSVFGGTQSCLVLAWLDFSWLGLAWLGLSCLVLSCPVLTCPVL